MKKLGLLLVGFIAVGSFSACMKGEPYDPDLQYGIEKELIEEYIASNWPNATFHEDVFGFGLWYELIEPGVPGEYQYKFVGEGIGRYIEAPTVQAKYTGKLLNGTVFDDNQSEQGGSIPLAGTIPAWQMMFLPKMIDGEEVAGVFPMGLHPGAKVRFITPSYHGYGNVQYGIIPPNSPLEFTIEVLDLLPPSGSGN